MNEPRPTTVILIFYALLFGAMFIAALAVEAWRSL